MNRTALIFIWIVAVAVVCGLLLADIRDSEGQEMIIPDGFDLWLDDDTVLAIPGGYVRPFRFSVLISNIGVGSVDDLYTLASDEMILITSVAAAPLGTLPTAIHLTIVSSLDLALVYSDKAPVVGEFGRETVNSLAIPGDVLTSNIAGGDATTDVNWKISGFQWKGVGQ